MKTILLFSFFTFLFFPSNLIASKLSSDLNPASSEVRNETIGVSIQQALKEFKSLSRKERRERIKELKKAVNDFKTEKKSGAKPSTNTLLLVILAILLPPLAVYLHEGVINNKFWLDLILTLIFFIPGVIYALIVILGNG